MNEILDTLKTQMTANAISLAAEEQYLTDLKSTIAKGVDVTDMPSRVIARIEYLKGLHMGLHTAVYALESAVKVGA
jgi:hypothetical protein